MWATIQRETATHRRFLPDEHLVDNWRAILAFADIHPLISLLKLTLSLSLGLHKSAVGPYRKSRLLPPAVANSPEAAKEKLKIRRAWVPHVVDHF